MRLNSVFVNLSIEFFAIFTTHNRAIIAAFFVIEPSKVRQLHEFIMNNYGEKRKVGYFKYLKLKKQYRLENQCVGGSSPPPGTIFI